MTDMQKPSVLDVTIRDGSYAIDYQFTPDMVAQISSDLDRANIEFIEVSHGCGLGASDNLGLTAAASDAEYVRAAKDSVKSAKVGVIAGPSPVTFSKDIDSIIEEVDFIRFFTSCANPRGVEEHLSYALKKRPDLTCFMQLTNSTRRPKEVIVEASHIAEDLGIDTMYVVDTTSHFLPDEVYDLVSELRSNAGIGIGFHGHDSMNLAVANTIAAVRAGATAIDASLRGLGRGGGNAQLEVIVSILGRLGLRGSYDLDGLISAAEKHIEPIMPGRKGVGPIDLITADANISLYPFDFFMRLADMADIPVLDLIQTFGEDKENVDVDLNGIKRALKKFDVDAEQVLNALGIKSD